jgi:hypothetical protein
MLHVSSKGSDITLESTLAEQVFSTVLHRSAAVAARLTECECDAPHIFLGSQLSNSILFTTFTTLPRHSCLAKVFDFIGR